MWNYGYKIAGGLGDGDGGRFQAGLQKCFLGPNCRMGRWGAAAPAVVGSYGNQEAPRGITEFEHVPLQLWFQEATPSVAVGDPPQTRGW